MGFMIVSSEWVKETENELESYKNGLAKMQREHDKCLAQYRKLRDEKDAVIADLHQEIEMHKKDKANLRRNNDTLRQIVAYYEARKVCNGTSETAV